MIGPGTVAAIAASLMAQGERLGYDSDMFSQYGHAYREKRISQFVGLALEIATETELQFLQLQSKPDQP